MRLRLFSLSVMLTIILLFFSANFYASESLNTLQIDSTDVADNIAIYKNVDVLEETDWCEPERIEQVDVTVKIYNHTNKKLLKTYGNK